MSMKPEGNEYPAYYAGYVQLVLGDSILTILEEQIQATVALLEGLTEEQAQYRYAEGKWSIKEVVGHMADTERVMSYRALRISRGDQTPLPGFDQDSFTAAAVFDRHTFKELLEDFAIVRKATLSLLNMVNEASWLNKGIMSDKEVTVRALGYIIAGHELHHIHVLQNAYLRGAL